MFASDPKLANEYFNGEFGGDFFPIDPEIHLIRHVHFTDFLNRELKADGRVFVYWHRDSRNWVVAAYNPQRGWMGMMEYLILNHDPEGDNPQLTPDQFHRLRAKWFEPMTGKENAEAVQSWNRQFKNQKVDRAREWIAKWQWRARQANPVRRDRNPDMAIARRHKRVYA